MNGIHFLVFVVACAVAFWWLLRLTAPPRRRRPRRWPYNPKPKRLL